MIKKQADNKKEKEKRRMKNSKKKERRDHDKSSRMSHFRFSDQADNYPHESPLVQLYHLHKFFLSINPIKIAMHSVGAEIYKVIYYKYGNSISINILVLRIISNFLLIILILQDMMFKIYGYSFPLTSTPHPIPFLPKYIIEKYFRVTTF